MKTSNALKILSMLGAFVVFVCLPQPVLAQRGGGGFHGGGGGGFHGGGGGFGGFHGSAGAFHGGGGSFHGGSAFHGGGHPGYGGGHYDGGYHGGYPGGYHGWHGGNGWHGHGWYGGHWHGYWGYPYWGFGFGWPYWGWGYPYYGYGYYGPWGYAPYSTYYPDNSDTCPPGYSCDDINGNGGDDPPPPQSTPKSQHAPVQPWRPSGHENQGPTYDGSSVESRNDSAPILSVDRIATTPSVPRTTPASMTVNHNASPRVQQAMRSLSEMPPFAREREINTGRYSQFTSKEKQQLRDAKY